MFWVLFCLTQSLIQHPHWSVCRSDVNTPAPLPLSVFFVWQLNTGLPVRVRLTDCLTSSLVCAMQFWPNVSSLSLSLSCRTVWCCLPVIHLLASPSLLLQQHCVTRRQYSSACGYLCLSLSSLCLPIYPLILPSGVSRTMEMRSVQKTAWVFLCLHTNTSFPSLTDSPLTGWSIHRCLVDTNNCWHSQKSCQPTTIK